MKRIFKSISRLKLFFLFLLGYLAFHTSILAQTRIKSVAYDEMCQCFRDIRNHNRVKFRESEVGEVIESNCGHVATARGPGQQVISFSLHGMNATRYLPGVRENAHLVAKHYPGYIVRIYIDPNGVTETALNHVCKLSCAEETAVNGKPVIIDLCDAGKVQGNADIPAGLPTVWRFAPMSDPTVAEWHSRDLDSRIGPREAAAVKEWREDNYEKPTFIIMNDHPLHLDYPIQGGIFGMRNYDGRLNLDRRKELLDEITSRAARRYMGSSKMLPNGGTVKFLDQIALKELVFPLALTDRAHYASFGCLQLSPSSKYRRAFPTKRQNGEFVAARLGEKLEEDCPEECRKQAKWEQC